MQRKRMWSTIAAAAGLAGLAGCASSRFHDEASCIAAQRHTIERIQAGPLPDAVLGEVIDPADAETIYAGRKDWSRDERALAVQRDMAHDARQIRSVRLVAGTEAMSCHDDGAGHWVGRWEGPVRPADPAFDTRRAAVVWFRDGRVAGVTWSVER